MTSVPQIKGSDSVGESEGARDRERETESDREREKRRERETEEERERNVLASFKKNRPPSSTLAPLGVPMGRPHGPPLKIP